MTALYMDGFDHYGSGTAGVANMLDGVWASVSGATISAPSWGTARTGTNCLQIQPTAGGSEAKIVVPGSPSILYASFGFSLDYLPPGVAVNLFSVKDVSNNLLYYVGVNPTGTVTLYNGSGTALSTSGGAVIKAQTWHFIEFGLNLSAGTFVLRVDDAQATNTPVISATGLTGTTVGFFSASYFTSTFNYLGYPQIYMDDLFLRNGSGTVNNGFLGDRRIALLLADADTTTAGWTPTYYKEFGTGVLALATLGTNTSTPSNINASLTMAGATALDVGSSDFTLETFVRFEQLPAATAYSTIFGRWDQAGNQRSYRLILGGSTFNGGSLQFDYSTGGTAGTVTTPIVYPFTPTINQWYHIAIVRASNQLLLFVNGIQLGLPIACTATFFGGGSEVFSLGAEWGNAGVVANTYLVGLMDETRFTNGFARYTTSFTPPTTAFPRGSGLDSHWSLVSYIASYDTIIADESSYTRTVTAQYGASQFTPSDGATIGANSAIGKAIPDDNTFISAPFVAATSILTMTTQPTNGTTVTVGTKNGSTAAVYTFKTTIASAFDVLIDTTAQNTLTNLLNAINNGTGAGTKFGTGTTANYNVAATALPAGQILVTANLAGTAGNSIATSSTSTASWTGTTLSGGLNIPGPSNFKVQPPPPNTTVISAMQSVMRGYKTDSGTSTVQPALIGGLGGTELGAAHTLVTNAVYYNDIYETDPDTSGPISPATILNGSLQVNRTA